jgi:hypothetical protein
LEVFKNPILWVKIVINSFLLPSVLTLFWNTQHVKQFTGQNLHKQCLIDRCRKNSSFCRDAYSSEHLRRSSQTF